MEYSDFLIWKVVVIGIAAFFYGIWLGITGR
jgi:hypothetical protein